MHLALTELASDRAASDLLKSRAFRNSRSTKEQKKEEVYYGKNSSSIPGYSYAGHYGVLPSVSADMASIEKGLFCGNGKIDVPIHKGANVRLYPGWNSWSQENVSFIRGFVTDLNANLVEKLDPEGFSLNGIVGNFDRLKTIAGMFGDRAPLPLKDNRLLRASLGLRNEFTQDEADIALEFWDIVWSELRVSKVNVPKMSSGGMRRFTSDVQWKLDFAEYLLESPGVLERYLGMLASNDFEGLCNEFEVVFAAIMQRRGQSDPPEKQRKAADMQYALSGGSSGGRHVIDKTVTIDGSIVEDFSPMRIRLVQAMSWSLTMLYQVACTCALYSLFERFPRTFHVNTEEEIEKVLEGWLVYPSDVTEFDSTQPKECLFDWRLTPMLKYFDERYVKGLGLIASASFFARPCEPGMEKGVWMSNPLSGADEDKFRAGNRSGDPSTAVTNKGSKVIDSLIVFHKIGFKVKGNIRSILQHKEACAIVNNGDDNMDLFLHQDDYDRFVPAREDPSVGLFLCERELGCGFSGKLISHLGNRKYKCLNKTITPFEKILVNERSIDSNFRINWPIGISTRVAFLSTFEEGKFAYELFQHHYRRVFPHMGDFASVLNSAYGRIGGLLTSYTSIETEVRDNPEKLFYKYTPDQVRKEVLEEVTSQVPVEVVAKTLDRIFHGHLL